MRSNQDLYTVIYICLNVYILAIGIHSSIGTQHEERAVVFVMDTRWQKETIDVRIEKAACTFSSACPNTEQTSLFSL